MSTQNAIVTIATVWPGGAREEVLRVIIGYMDLIPKPIAQQALRRSHLSETANPHRVNQQLREVFREAFDHLGGSAWLVEFATANDQNARVFVQAMSKLLPASASPIAGEKVIIDIPWLTRDRLAYKEGQVDADVVDLVPKEQ
jgi:hypothetical protein